MLVPDDTADVSSLSLSELEFDVLAEHVGLDPIPLVLKVPSPGRTRAERAELVESAWETLTARGLGQPSRPCPELRRLMDLLAHPEREIDGRVWLGHSVRVLAAATADDAVLAVKEHGTVTLRSVAATGLPRAALSLLPPRSAGPGRSVSVRSADLDAAAAEAGRNVEEVRDALVRRGVRPDDAETLFRMVGEADFRGQFGAAARTRSDKRIRAGHVVAFFDTPHGRYVQLRRESTPGDPWSTIAPADPRRMAGHVEDILAEVTGHPNPVNSLVR